MKPSSGEYGLAKYIDTYTYCLLCEAKQVFLIRIEDSLGSVSQKTLLTDSVYISADYVIHQEIQFTFILLSQLYMS
jgi:hypothetical protein